MPKLSEMLKETNPKIRNSAIKGLTLIGSTIQNPEVSRIVDILIIAISDPYENNEKGLEILLKTTFVHYVDAPSLSLLIPIIEYGLRSRHSIMRLKASQIIGTISRLIKDPRNMLPYIDMLIKAFLFAISDVEEKVRNIATKSLAKFLQSLGTKVIGKIIEGFIVEMEGKTKTSIERIGFS